MTTATIETVRLPARARNLARQLLPGVLLVIGWQWLVSLTHQWPSEVAWVHGRGVWLLERSIGLPNERSVQQLVDTLHASQLANVYYDLAHVGVTAAVLVLLWRRNRAGYVRTRNVLIGVTITSLLLELWQVAPPRLIGVGVVDTAHRAGVSIYDSAGHLVPQFDALPSLHVGWALVAAYGLAQLGRRRLGAVHVAVTVLVVVATGNHYWLDCIAAAAVFRVVLALRARLEQRTERKSA